MKTLLLGLLVLTSISETAFASHIHLICTNASGTIVVENGFGRFKQPWYENEDNFISLEQEENFKISGERTDIDKKVTCSSSEEVYVLKAKFVRVEADQKMPNTASVLTAEDGSLSETLLCRRSISWMGNCQ